MCHGRESGRSEGGGERRDKNRDGSTLVLAPMKYRSKQEGNKPSRFFFAATFKGGNYSRETFEKKNCAFALF